MLLRLYKSTSRFSGIGFSLLAEEYAFSLRRSAVVVQGRCVVCKILGLRSGQLLTYGSSSFNGCQNQH